jgi:hypothetical protein
MIPKLMKIANKNAVNSLLPLSGQGKIHHKVEAQKQEDHYARQRGSVFLEEFAASTANERFGARPPSGSSKGAGGETLTFQEFRRAGYKSGLALARTARRRG